MAGETFDVRNFFDFIGVGPDAKARKNREQQAALDTDMKRIQYQEAQRLRAQQAEIDAMVNQLDPESKLRVLDHVRQFGAAQIRREDAGTRGLEQDIAFKAGEQPLRRRGLELGNQALETGIEGTQIGNKKSLFDLKQGKESSRFYSSKVPGAVNQETANFPMMQKIGQENIDSSKGRTDLDKARVGLDVAQQIANTASMKAGGDPEQAFYETLSGSPITFLRELVAPLMAGKQRAAAEKADLKRRMDSALSGEKKGGKVPLVPLSAQETTKLQADPTMALVAEKLGIDTRNTPPTQWLSLIGQKMAEGSRRSQAILGQEGANRTPGGKVGVTPNKVYPVPTLRSFVEPRNLGTYSPYQVNKSSQELLQSQNAAEGAYSTLDLNKRMESLLQKLQAGDKSVVPELLELVNQGKGTK